MEMMDHGWMDHGCVDVDVDVDMSNFFLRGSE
jgi:hypothetical protein